MRVILTTMILVLSHQNLYAQVSYVPFANTLKEGGNEISFETTYFQTTSVAGVDSKTTSLPAGTSNQRIDFDFTGKYGFTNQLEGLVGLRGRFIQSQFSFDAGTGIEDYKLTRSGAESVVIGAEYSLKEVEGAKYSLQGYYRQALHSSHVYSGGDPEVLVLGDDSREYGVGINFYYRTKSLNVLDAQVLYRSPGESLSQEIYSRVQGGLVWKSAALYLGIENVYSLEADPYTNDPENKPFLLQGSSAQFNSVNRQWTAPYAGLNISLGEKWRMGVEYAQVSTGTSTDLGQRVLFKLVRRTDIADNSYAKRDQKFKQYRIEGLVTKMATSRKVAVVDQGVEKGLRKGMKVDFYHFNFVGGNELIATGVVIRARASKSLVRIIKRLSKKRVDEGTVIRADELQGSL
jgi:hypothetical protein